jgi:signal transduction protein with GAF and PtsI domain
VASKEPLVVEDAREHPVLKNSPAIQDLGIIAYAGAPLLTPEGQALGTLCVIDAKPRQWSAEQIGMLCSLAATLTSTISYRAEARARPADRRTRDASKADANSTAQLAQAGNALHKAVSAYLASLDEYEQCTQSSARQAREFECQNAVLDAKRRLKQVTHELHERLEVLGGTPDDPDLQASIELWRACVAYFNAEKRRSSVMTLFLEGRASMAEVKHEAMLVAQTEQELRMALRSHQQRG